MNKIFFEANELDNNIASQDDFDESIFAGADKLLNAKSYKDCLFADSEKGEYVGELFYFLEGNGALLDTQDDKILYELDEIRYVLIDNNEEQTIVILKKDLSEIENFV